VKIQKEFKVTPHYLEMSNDLDNGYKMGVYLCLGQQIYNMKFEEALNISELNNFKSIQDYVLENNGKLFLLLGIGTHKIKRKAEQIACNVALNALHLTSEL
jgi:hypothetical protein